MSWTAPAMLLAIKDVLDEWPDLTDVAVTTYPLSKPKAFESVMFFSAPGDQRWSALGNQSKEDSYTLEGMVEVIRKGAGEDPAVSAMERARDIISAVEDALRDCASSGLGDLASAVDATQITNLSMGSISLFQGATQDGNRFARVPFDIVVKARI